jgi:hypothetical protein
MDDEGEAASKQDLCQSRLCLPNEQEVFRFMLSTLRHSNHFHYYAAPYYIGLRDPEIPHDLVGTGNKYELEVINGLALVFRTPNTHLREHIYASRKIHRQQYHHIKGNGDVPSHDATEEDLRVWALDTACAMLENRPYEPPVKDLDELLSVFNTFLEPKKRVGREIVSWIKALPRPRLEFITSLDSFPNIGIPENIYQEIVSRTSSVVGMLRERGYALDRMSCSESDIQVSIT